MTKKPSFFMDASHCWQRWRTSIRLGVITPPSPSPWPSPQGRGNSTGAWLTSVSARIRLRVWSAAQQLPRVLMAPRSSKNRLRFSLSPGERAGVRGKDAASCKKVRCAPFSCRVDPFDVALEMIEQRLVHFVKAVPDAVENRDVLGKGAHHF